MKKYYIVIFNMIFIFFLISCNDKEKPDLQGLWVVSNSSKLSYELTSMRFEGPNLLYVSLNKTDELLCQYYLNYNKDTIIIQRMDGYMKCHIKIDENKIEMNGYNYNPRQQYDKKGKKVQFSLIKK